MKEHGAQRSLLDQVEYTLDGLEARQGISTRRNCALELATLCATNIELSFLFRCASKDTRRGLLISNVATGC